MGARHRFPNDAGAAHPPHRVGKSDRNAVKVVFVRILDQHLDDIARLQPRRVAEVDFAVDLGCVGFGAAGGADVVVVRGMGGVEVGAVGAFDSPPLPAPLRGVALSP